MSNRVCSLPPRSFVLSSTSRLTRLLLLLLFFVAFAVSPVFSRQPQVNGNSNRAYRKAVKRAQKGMRKYAKQQRKAMKKSAKAQRKALKRSQRNNAHY